MDEAFFAELEESISNVGADDCWQRTIGGRQIWFAPITATGQAKVQETLTKSDLGGNALNETKRVTLSHAVVGIDSLDLRQYRRAGPVFGPIKIGDKSLRVEMHTYIYHKMAGWGQQLIDDAFDVYADLLETHQKENLKDVKFENSKNPRDELAELMVRVVELRMRLGLPMLVEETPRQDETDDETDEVESFKAANRPAPPPDDGKLPPEEFDPFKVVQSPGAGKTEPAPPPAVEAAPFVPPPAPAWTPAPSPPTPVVTVPVPQPRPAAHAAPGPVPGPVRGAVAPGMNPNILKRANEISSLEGMGKVGQMSSPDNPIVGNPRAIGDVIDKPAPRGPVASPPIDQIPQNRSAKFQSPRGPRLR